MSENGDATPDGADGATSDDPFSPGLRDLVPSEIPPAPKPVPPGVRMTREIELWAWVGKRENLERLVSTIEDALSTAYNTFVASLHDTPEFRRTYDAARAAEALQLEIEFTANGGNLVRAGSVASVLAEMDASDVESVTIRSHGIWSTVYPLPEFKLELGRQLSYGSQKSVSLKISGTDRPWVGGLYDSLARDLRAKQPWWAQFRRRGAGASVGLLFAAGLFGWLYANSSGTARLTPVGVINLVIFFGAFGLMFGETAMRRILRFAFPGFELLEPGTTPRGRQVFAFLGTATGLGLSVLGIVLGLRAS